VSGYAADDVSPTLAITTSTEITAATIARQRYGSLLQKHSPPVPAPVATGRRRAQQDERHRHDQRLRERPSA